MSTVSPIPAPVQRLLREQAGVLSREQALSSGLTQRRIDRYVAEGHWQRVATGILCASPGPPEWRSLAWAGILIAPDGAALSGLAAAHLWNLTPDPAIPISVRLAPGDQVCRRDHRWHFERTRQHFRPVGQLPRLSAEHTVLDLCAAEPATLRFGWHQCHDQACAVARMVGALLIRLGWKGPFKRCRHCRTMPEQMIV